ncbi:MAG: iron oxidase [Actinomycetia bacterium]|nr:iron oxidase [Actinomycetes bacterium]
MGEVGVAGAIPVVDVTAIVAGPHDAPAVARVASEIDHACRTVGFFSIVGHGIDAALRAALIDAAEAFFAHPDDEKAQIAMARGGRAWRGWFPVGGELTSGQPDHKEGIYFGAELASDDPRVLAGTPLHGANLFPAAPAILRNVVLRYIDACTELGASLMRAIGAGLGIDTRWFEQAVTTDPLVLFRIFRYPPDPGPRWSVAEHTDYGLLTILMQDGTGGLQVHAPSGWIDVPPDPDAFVCNIGDMLERMTAGQYRSTPHRVRNASNRSRLSFPFFYDPSWDALVQPVPGANATSARARKRWDGADPLTFTGTYGDYLFAKVARVFPELGAGTF